MVIGCPDDDEDGLANHEDDCPKQAGSIENGGCPAKDSDQDGFTDDIDNCPKVPGKVGGCPDIDNDGVADKDDRCPQLPGPVNAQGCPDTD